MADTTFHEWQLAYRHRTWGIVRHGGKWHTVKPIYSAPEYGEKRKVLHWVIDLALGDADGVAAWAASSSGGAERREAVEAVDMWEAWHESSVPTGLSRE